MNKEGLKLRVNSSCILICSKPVDATYWDLNAGSLRDFNLVILSLGQQRMDIHRESGLDA